MYIKSDPLPIGTRVRHIGEQYPEARKGTGTIVKVVRYYAVDNTYEYLVQMDKPHWITGETLMERNHMVEVYT